jgi:hypothetical protein
MRLDGADKNQKYYLCADLQADLYLDSVYKKTDVSEFSNLAGVTTKDEPQETDPAGQAPPAPVLGKRSVNLSSATIFWDRILPMGDGDVMEYEIIRLDDQQLPSNMLDNRASFAEFWSSALAPFRKAGWRTDGTSLEAYDGGFHPADPSKAQYNPAAAPIEFSDFSLSPNSVYFYYVRTARIVGGVRVVSVWTGASLTTIPVQSPKNLRAELDWEDYDPKTEIVVSFDAPIMDLSLLESEFSLQRQLGGPGYWSEPATINPSDLSPQKSPEAGYTKFFTKVSGLKPATLYSIRVRMIDSSGGASIYTNLIQFRTDVDKDDYENDRKTSNWLDYLKDLLKGLLKTPYWPTRDDSESFEAVYRPDMLQGFLGSAPGNLIPLPAGNGKASSYYLPASYIEGANGQGKGFIISKDGFDLILSPNAINTASNDAAISIGHKILSGKASDYYLRLSVEWIDGGADKTASVAASLVGSLVDTGQWSDDMISALAAIVDNDLKDEGLYDFISSSVGSGVLSQDISRALGSLESSVKDASKRVAASRLRPSLRYSYPIISFDRPLILVAKGFPDTSRVAASRWQNRRWLPLEAERHGSGVAAYTLSPGVHRFLSSPVAAPRPYTAAGAGSIREIVAKHSLEDFFGSGPRLNLGAPVSRAALAGSACRVLGAPRQADPFLWLKSAKGISISAGNPASPASWQEAVHMAMLVFSSKASLVQDSLAKPPLAASASPDYKTAVASALELGVISEPSPNPKAPVSVLEYLQMLEAVNRKTPL